MAEKLYFAMQRSTRRPVPVLFHGAPPKDQSNLIYLALVPARIASGTLADYEALYYRLKEAGKLPDNLVRG